YNTPYPSPVLRQGWRPAHAAGWQMVESYHLDDGWRCHQLHARAIRALCSGPHQGPVPGLALEVFLCAIGHPQPRADGVGWTAVSPLGHILPRHPGPACDVDGQLAHALLRKPAVCHPRRLTEQLVRSAVEFRRGLAQQSSRLSIIGATWTRLV